MDVPVYKLNGIENNYNNKAKRSNKDTEESILFSQESQSNTQNNIDNKDNFWNNLRNLWNGNNKIENDGESLAEDFTVEKRFNILLNHFNEFEYNVKLLNTKVDGIEKRMVKYNKSDIIKQSKGIKKTIQRLQRKFLLQNDKCARVFSNIECLLKNIDDSTNIINSFNEKDDEDIIVISASEIKLKFESILDNILSDLSSESLILWNDILLNFYSNNGKSSNYHKISTKNNNNNISRSNISPGELVVNSLRRSERIKQNKTVSNVNMFGNCKAVQINGTKVRNTTQHSDVFSNVTGNIKESKVKLKYRSTESRSIKKSIEIFKYCEDINSSLKHSKGFGNTAGQLLYNQFSNHKNLESIRNSIKDSDSDFDAISLRRLFKF